MSTKFITGQHVTIVPSSNRLSHGFADGTDVTIESGPDKDGDYIVRGPRRQSGERITQIVQPADIAPITPAKPHGKPERPFIDFKFTRYATAREYAREAQSRVLKPESNATLEAVALGLQVDAYDLNEAVLDAMRSAATRHGQSLARRGLATRIAHLGHIVQAVLENHADNLPAYQTGERSRAVEDAKEALREAKSTVDSLTSDLSAARQQREHMAAEARDLRAEIDEAKLSLADRAQEITVLHDNLCQITSEANEFEAALAYAKGFLDDEARARVDGFLEGFQKGSES